MKKRFVALFLTFIIFVGIGVGVVFSRADGADSEDWPMYDGWSMYIDNTSSVDSISRREAVQNKLAEVLALVIKDYENVDDVVIDTGASPLQVNIVTKSTDCLTAEAKEHIEKLVNDTFQDSTVEYLASDTINNCYTRYKHENQR